MKRLTKVDENAHWWIKEKTDWAIEDKKGNWWIIPGSEFPEAKVNKKTKTITKRRRQSSFSISINLFLLMFFASLLGISLALNLLYLLK